MVAEAARLPHQVPLPEGTRLHRLTRPEEAGLVAEVHQAAFGDDRARTRAWVRDLLTDRADSSAVVVVLDGDRPLSAGGWSGTRAGSSPGCGAAVPSRPPVASACTGRWSPSGPGSPPRGVRWVQVDATDRSRPILERLGFRTLTTTTPYVWTPAAG
ncbi:hypothetical protein ACFQVA_05440 [Actinomadura keratinilytica]